MKKGMIFLISGILEGSGDLRVRTFAPVGGELPRVRIQGILPPRRRGDEPPPWRRQEEGV